MEQMGLTASAVPGREMEAWEVLAIMEEMELPELMLPDSSLQLTTTPLIGVEEVVAEGEVVAVAVVAVGLQIKVLARAFSAPAVAV